MRFRHSVDVMLEVSERESSRCGCTEHVVETDLEGLMVRAFFRGTSSSPIAETSAFSESNSLRDRFRRLDLDLGLDGDCRLVTGTETAVAIVLWSGKPR